MHIGTERALRDLNRIESAANDVCLQLRNLQGLCRVLGFLSAAGNTDGLDPHELGHVALLMEDVVKEAMSGIEHIEVCSVAACSTAPICCCTCGTVDMKMSSPRALLMS